MYYTGPAFFYFLFCPRNWLAEQKVIQSIKIDYNKSSSKLFAAHVSKMLCFIFLGRKLLGRNLLEAYSLLDQPMLAVCIKILFNSTTYDLTYFWSGSLFGLVLWLLQSLFRFPPLLKYTKPPRAEQIPHLHFSVSNAFCCWHFYRDSVEY